MCSGDSKMFTRAAFSSFLSMAPGRRTKSSTSRSGDKSRNMLRSAKGRAGAQGRGSSSGTRSRHGAATMRRQRGSTNTVRNPRHQGDRWERVQPYDRGISVKASELKLQRKLTPDNCPALVLNADYQPLSYMPLSLWPWQDVVKAVFLDRVNIVATYDIGVRSPSMILPLPSVVSLKQYRPVHLKRPAFSRFNVFMRDLFTCQYCGQRYPTPDLTFDHVVPRCRNGKTNWQNVVTACVNCNHKKGRKMLSELPRDFRLKKKPAEPTHHLLQAHARQFPPQYLHESWRDYVYWSQSMHVEA